MDKLAIFFYIKNLHHRVNSKLPETLSIGGVSHAKQNLSQFKARVMNTKGHNVNNNNPDDVKYEVTKEQGISKL